MKHWADYVIFSGFILISLSIGLYHALTGGRQRTTEEFIMADRKLKLLPVALSLLMSYQSAITIIGVPAEIYSYGIQAWPMWNLGFWLALILSERLFVPWLYPLKLTSVNKYFELRFGDREIRAFACLVGVLSAIMYMGVCMFAPAVALETATGFPTMASIPAMSIVCIIYTAMGGMRAVIWTDVFQFGVMLAGMLAVLIRGMILVGGAPNAFDTLVQEGRDELINISPSLLERQTLWGYIFGWSLQWGCVFGLQQAAVQRFSAMPSLRGARLSLLLNMPGLLLVNSLANLIGITVFAYYTMEKCDPILSGTISDPNQLLPQFVNEIFANANGFSGLFLATLFSGALSSVSSSLSGAAANVWEDILKYRLPGIQEHKAAIINKCLVVVLGLLAAGFAFLSAVMTGPVAQLAIAFFGACGGPLLGLFILSGIRQFRWIRSRAVLAGAMLGLIVNMWLSIAAAFVKGKYEVLPPLSVEHCDPPTNTTLPAAPVITGIDKFYSLSFLWYTPLGCVITIVIGLSVSAIINACNKPKYSRDVPENLFIPFSQVFSFCDKEYSPVSQGDKDTTNKECQMIDLLEEKIQTLTD